MSFELPPGRVLELAGPNGSGKTSLLRLAAGLAMPSGGELHWNGELLRPGDPGYARCMAYLGHQNGVSGELSPLENLRFAQRTEGRGQGEPSAAIEAWGLAAVSHQPVRRLSQGQRRRLALARVWLARRSLWLLDEPCAALDLAGQTLFDQRLSEHLQAGGAAVVATHRPLAVPSSLRLSLNLHLGQGVAPC